MIYFQNIREYRNKLTGTISINNSVRAYRKMLSRCFPDLFLFGVRIMDKVFNISADFLPEPGWESQRIDIGTEIDRIIF